MPERDGVKDVAVNRRAQVRFRANGNQGDLVGVTSYLVQEEIHGALVVLVRGPTFCISSLAQGIHLARRMLRDPHGNGNVRAAGFLQKTAQQTGAEMRVAPGAGNS